MNVKNCADCHNQLSVVIYDRMTYGNQGTALNWSDLLTKPERAFAGDRSHNRWWDRRRKIAGFVNLSQRNETKSLPRILLTNIRVHNMVNTALQGRLDRSINLGATVSLGCRIGPEWGEENLQYLPWTNPSNAEGNR